MKETPQTLSRAPIEYQSVPRSRPNCGVVALAHFTGQPYDRVEKFLRRGKPSTWKGSTYTRDYYAFFARIGLPVVRRDDGAGELLRDWVAKYTQPGTRYMVITTGHAQVVYDGAVIDQHAGLPVPVEEFHWRRKRVKRWFIIDAEDE